MSRSTFSRDICLEGPLGKADCDVLSVRCFDARILAKTVNIVNAGTVPNGFTMRCFSSGESWTVGSLLGGLPRKLSFGL
jgi:hypothetical protein